MTLKTAGGESSANCATRPARDAEGLSKGMQEVMRRRRGAGAGRDQLTRMVREQRRHEARARARVHVAQAEPVQVDEHHHLARRRRTTQRGLHGQPEMIEARVGVLGSTSARAAVEHLLAAAGRLISRG